MEELDGVINTISKLKDQLKEIHKTTDGVFDCLINIQKSEFSVNDVPIRRQLKEFVDVISVKDNWSKEEIRKVLIETVIAQDKEIKQKYIKLEK